MVQGSSNPDSCQRGFTLVELMITLGVAAILFMIAVPGFRDVILSNRLTTSANSLVDAVNAARLEAIKLNASTQFCGSTSAINATDALGTACGTVAGAVYSRPPGAAGAGVVRATPLELTSPIEAGGDGVKAVRFSGQGFGYKPTDTTHAPFNDRIAVICTSALSSNNQRIVSMTAGAIVASASSTGNCP